ncbi:enoyl-CoA hydratase [Nocardia sp. NPDC004654]|uniref:enoyl-CoA hydratase n=1 Tax=Nocardia sp. NPDC004654 TaxID=3154776 RepID=UPI0033AD4CF6
MIVTSTNGDVAVITIDRHDKRNALDLAHLAHLHTAITTAVENGARALVLTGQGTTFSAGADLDGVYTGGFRSALYRTLQALTSAPIPVIAAVNGPAIGAGTQLALACDLRIAAPTAVFAVPTARNGLAVDPWTIRRLALLAGGGTARAILLACDTIGADQALSRGLADRIGTREEAIELAGRIAGFAPLSLAYCKRALEQLLEDEPAPDELVQDFDRCWASEDFAEARRARAERRDPRFVGR